MFIIRNEWLSAWRRLWQQIWQRPGAQYNEGMPRGYITTTEAAERLGITRHAVIALIKRGSLPAEKFGVAWIIKEKDLATVQNRKVGRPRKRLTK